MKRKTHRKTNPAAQRETQPESDRPDAASGGAPLSRGAFLQRGLRTALGLGVLGAGGSALFSGFGDSSGRAGGLYARETSKPEDVRAPSPVKSVIYINLDGGASHVDMFDPNKNTIFGTVRSACAGAVISDRLSKTAKELGPTTIVRSLYSEEGDHGRGKYLMHSGYRQMASFSDQPSIGSVIAFAKQSEGPYFPDHITLGGRNGLIGQAGFLGSRFDSMHVSNADKPLSNLQPSGRTDPGRFYRRGQLLEALNESFAGRIQGGETRAWEEMHVAALEFMNSDRLAVFDISRENAQIQARYGNSHFGKSLLMARRLAEAGVPFIEVTTGGWDTHNNHRERMTKLLGGIDQPIAALLGELRASGLLDQTLVVITSEFGRTPRIASNGDGRDHHPRAWSAVLAGGPVPQGLVYGATDEMGARPQKDAIHASAFVATLYRAAGVNPYAALYTRKGRPMTLVPSGHEPADFLQI